MIYDLSRVGPIGPIRWVNEDGVCRRRWRNRYYSDIQFCRTVAWQFGFKYAGKNSPIQSGVYVNGSLEFWQFVEWSESWGALILGQTNGLIFVAVKGKPNLTNPWWILLGFFFFWFYYKFELVFKIRMKGGNKSANLAMILDFSVSFQRLIQISLLLGKLLSYRTVGFNFAIFNRRAFVLRCC